MIRIALVGRGAWGTRIEKTLSEIPQVEIITVSREEPVPEGVSGAIIASPSSTHAEVVLPYIKRGLPVFIEKPMTTDITDALRLKGVALESGSAVFVGHLYLFHGAFRALQSALIDLGSIKKVSFVGHSTSSRDDGSPLWDWLPHGLSLARAVLKSEPSSVLISINSVGQQEGTYFFGDVPMDFSVAWDQHQKQMRFTVIAEGGELIFDDVGNERVIKIKQGEKTVLTHDTTPPLTTEMRSFVRVVGGEERPPVGARISDGVSIVRAIQGAETSARLHLNVPLP